MTPSLLIRTIEQGWIYKGRVIRHLASQEHMTDKAFVGVVIISRSSFMALVEV